MAKKKKTDQLTYQSAYQELEVILTKIQNEELNLDQMATAISRAKELIHFCQEKLRSVETEVEAIFVDEDEA